MAKATKKTLTKRRYKQWSREMWMAKDQMAYEFYDFKPKACEGAYPFGAISMYAEKARAMNFIKLANGECVRVRVTVEVLS